MSGIAAGSRAAGGQRVCRSVGAGRCLWKMFELRQLGSRASLRASSGSESGERICQLQKQPCVTPTIRVGLFDSDDAPVDIRRNVAAKERGGEDLDAVHVPNAKPSVSVMLPEQIQLAVSIHIRKADDMPVHVRA